MTQTGEGVQVETDIGPTVEISTPVPRWGPATPLVITAGIWVVSLLSWWLLADPRWGVPDVSQAAVGSLLFWTILAFIFTGFTFGNWPFSKLSQPLAGVAQVAFDVVLGFFAVWLFTFVVGSWDATFSHAAKAGAGFTAAAFVVLIGFYAYSLVAASWGGYPFEAQAQPSAGVSQFFLAAFITMLGTIVLIYPNFSAALAKGAPVSLPTATGWVYCSIVILLLAAMLWENWPWSMIQNRHLRALGAVVASMGGGYVLFLVFREIVKAVVPGNIKSMPSFTLDLEAAQLGVCFSLWSLTWGLVWGAPPKSLGPTLNRLVRTAIVTVLSVGTYVIFMRFGATKVLHFAAIKDNYGGSPLVWMDWVILVLLWYAVAFGGFFSTRRARA
jgi:amino acid transporter, AAT family